ncbi:MAG: hypothetical protein OXF27_10070 [Acidobacteria bacterium]|nr:hypothetical protein [Acidobacteriota bacterium]
MGCVTEGSDIAFGSPLLAVGQSAGSDVEWRHEEMGSEVAVLFGPWRGDSAPVSGLILVVGGGLDVRVWRGLTIGAEVRWPRILLSRWHFDTALVVSRLTCRF